MKRIMKVLEEFMGSMFRTLVLLAALLFYFLGDGVIGNWLLGIWAFLVIFSFWGKRVAKKEKEKKEKDKIDGYAIAEQEIETNEKDEDIWKKAFVDGGGDENKQKALYMKYRAEEIINS